VQIDYITHDVSCDSMMLYSWHYNIQNCRIQNLPPGSTVHVDPLSTHSRRTFYRRIQLIRLRTLGEETFGVTVHKSETCQYSVLLQLDGNEQVAKS